MLPVITPSQLGATQERGRNVVEPWKSIVALGEAKGVALTSELPGGQTVGERQSSGWKKNLFT